MQLRERPHLQQMYLMNHGVDTVTLHQLVGMAPFHESAPVYSDVVVICGWMRADLLE